MWPTRQSAKQRQGEGWEQHALAYLQRQGLQLVESNFRCKAGEIDLILRDGDALVFVEVRQRQSRTHGGAAASNVFTRIQLALYGEISWKAIPSMPVEMILQENYEEILVDSEYYTEEQVESGQL